MTQGGVVMRHRRHDTDATQRLEAIAEEIRTDLHHIVRELIATQASAETGNELIMRTLQKKNPGWEEHK